MPQFFWFFQGDEKADEVGDGALENRRIGAPRAPRALGQTPNETMGFLGNFHIPLPIGSMYAIYGNMVPINIPPMLVYIYHTWILWVGTSD